MGFQTADIKPLAEKVATLAGVSGVWLLPGSDDRSCTMWVGVKGLDEQGHSHRMVVRDLVEGFIAERQVEMSLSGFMFDFHVSVDEPDFGALQIPRAAIRIASAV